MTDTDGGSLLTKLQKEGRIHTILGRLTAEAVPVPDLAELTLIGVDQDGGPHILHSLFSVLFRIYDLDRRFFRCCGELPLGDSPQSRIFLWLPTRYGVLSGPCLRKNI